MSGISPLGEILRTLQAGGGGKSLQARGVGKPRETRRRTLERQKVEIVKQ